MDAVIPTFPPIILWAIPFFAFTLFFEWAMVARGNWAGRYEAKDALTSIGMGLGNVALDLVLGFIAFGALMWIWQFRIFDLGTGLFAILGAVVAFDFIYYWQHRAGHRMRWFWAAHIVHHSSQHYNLSTALRQTWGNHFTGLFLLAVPLVLLGFHPALLAFVGAANLIYQYWIHTEAIDKLPAWFEAVFNTPSHHRVHHGTLPQYLDCNYAGIFIIWDKMFGSFVPEKEGVFAEYGLVQNIETHNLIKVAYAELWGLLKDVVRPGLSVSERFKYVFAPPGYSHDGSRDSSEDIKEKYVTEHPDMAGQAGLPEVPSDLSLGQSVK